MASRTLISEQNNNPDSDPVVPEYCASKRCFEILTSSIVAFRVKISGLSGVPGTVFEVEPFAPIYGEIDKRRQFGSTGNPALDRRAVRPYPCHSKCHSKFFTVESDRRRQ